YILIVADETCSELKFRNSMKTLSENDLTAECSNFQKYTTAGNTLRLASCVKGSSRIADKERSRRIIAESARSSLIALKDRFNPVDDYNRNASLKKLYQGLFGEDVLRVELACLTEVDEETAANHAKNLIGRVNNLIQEANRI